MKLACYMVALMVLLACSAQVVRAQLSASQPVFCPDLVGCVPVTDVQWVAAMAAP